MGKTQTDTYEKVTRTPHNTIVAGDFNIIKDPLDAKNNKNFKMTPAAKHWKNYTEAYKLRDIWRWRNPRLKLIHNNKNKTIQTSRPNLRHRRPHNQGAEMHIQA